MATSTGEVTLREVGDADIELFHEHQRDPDASRMAQFPSRELPLFLAHWRRILADEAVVARTILCDGQVAGNIVSYLDDDGRREVGYWLGRAWWGRGIATRALTLLLELDPHRPLFAFAATGNIASVRVLQKCGFVFSEEDDEGTTLELAAGER